MPSHSAIGIGWIDWARPLSTRLGDLNPSFLRPPRNYINRLHHTKLPENPYPQNSEKYKMSQNRFNDNINSFYTHSFNNVWNNYTVADERSQILAWLSPLEPRIRHHDIRTRRVNDVGDWLLQTGEYRNWSGGIHGGGSDGAALFCYGGLGVGKTYIR